MKMCQTCCVSPECQSGGNVETFTTNGTVRCFRQRKLLVKTNPLEQLQKDGERRDGRFIGPQKPPVHKPSEFLCSRISVLLISHCL
jgi:hypothetical protein